MSLSILPPMEPREPAPPQPHMVDVSEPLKWEYKQVTQDVEKEGPLSEDDLNVLGVQGWELASTLAVLPLAHYYFKRIRN
jgi:hypothetical protein